MSIDDTRSAYDKYANREWNRLETGAQARLEYLVTTYALSRHLPSSETPVRILDAGGGPGRYTTALAAQGYRVTLLDLSPKLLDIARSKIAELPAPTRDRIDDVVEASITDLSLFPDETFDAVLCLGGPLSHLVESSARTVAIQELRRVAKPGGLLFVSVMGRIGQYRSAVQWPDWFNGVFPKIAETGVATITSERAPVYFFFPEAFRRELEDAGLTVERMYGCQGIGAHLDENNLLALMADSQRWSQWERELLATCDHPTVVGISNHILAVARKSGN
jgi:SAM-dependent methyltransferase